MLAVPQSTSLLVVFKAFLSSDHVSEATGKTIAITISKNGGAFGNPNAGATNATEISSGWYKVTLDTTDTGTLGPLAIRGAVANVDDVGVFYQVVKATNGGLTALPDAAAEAAGGLYTRGTGAGQIRQDANGRIDANVKAYGDSAGTFASGRPEVNTTHIAGSAVSTTSAQIGVNVVNAAGTAWGSGAITAASIAAAALNGKGDWNIGKTGYSLSATQTFDLTGNITGNLSGSVGSVTGNVGGNVVGSVGSVTAGVTVTTNNDKTGYALTAAYDFAKGTSAMTESYAANGAAPTPIQAMYAIHQMLMQFAIASTTITVKKLDNTTTAFAVTLDDATTPTSAVRT